MIKSKNLALMTIFLTVFSFGIHAKSVHSEDYTPEIVTVAAVKNRELNLVSVSTMLVGEQILGSMVLYKEATTKRDYVEFYDNEGDLVAVNWFDRFGIHRMGIDRGLLEGAPRLEGVLVVFLDGQAV